MFYDSIRTRLVDTISSWQRLELIVYRDHEVRVQITQQFKLEINPIVQNTELSIRITRCHLMFPSHDERIINKQTNKLKQTTHPRNQKLAKNNKPVSLYEKDFKIDAAYIEPGQRVLFSTGENFHNWKA